jgi:hypothetical protein
MQKISEKDNTTDAYSLDVVTPDVQPSLVSVATEASIDYSNQEVSTLNLPDT